jgi:hypothetical protein
MEPTIQPTNWGMIANYGVQMTVVVAIGLGVYTIKVLASRVKTQDWYQENALRITISIALCWLIGAALVVVPNVSTIFGAFGFNADQSPAAIAIVIVGFLIKNTTEVASDNPGSIDRRKTQ